jgi:hypothetical protein
MKKTLLTAAALLIGTGVFAQKKQFFSFGLKAGTTLSQLRGDDLSLASGTAFQFGDNSNRSWGFTGGAFLRFGRTFFFQPELLVTQKRGEFDLDRGLTNERREIDLRFSNLDVPLLFGFKIGNTLRLNAGPMVTFRLGEDGRLSQIIGPNPPGEDPLISDNALFGYQMGVGLDLGRLNLDVRYEGNLTEAFFIQTNNPARQAQFDRKSNLWQATLGFAIF